jgi:hypothetical protein
MPRQPRAYPCPHQCGRQTIRVAFPCCLNCLWHQTQPGDFPRHSVYCNQRAARDAAATVPEGWWTEDPLTEPLPPVDRAAVLHPWPRSDDEPDDTSEPQRPIRITDLFQPADEVVATLEEAMTLLLTRYPDAVFSDIEWTEPTIWVWRTNALSQRADPAQAIAWLRQAPLPRSPHAR